MKKRILSILLTLCMVLMLVPVTAFAEEQPGVIIGDLNLDSEVTVSDAVHLQNYLEGLESFTDVQLAVADYNGDGVVDYSDLTDLQRSLELPESGITVTKGKATACGTEIIGAAEGTRVTLTADTPPDAMEFDKWIVESGSITLADANSATTTFTMLAGPVSVTATYKPLSAGETGTLAVTVDGFEVGKTPADCTYSFESTIPGVTFSADDVQSVVWARSIFDGVSFAWEPIGNYEAFEAGVSYRIQMNLDNKGLNTAPAVTVNGKTPEYCTIATRDGVPIQLQIGWTLGTPVEPTPVITINGPDVVCAEQDYEFTVTPPAGVTLDKTFGYDAGSGGSEGDLTVDEAGVGHGMVSAEGYDLQTNRFTLTAQGTDPGGNTVPGTKTVQVSPEHIYVDGVCGCGAVEQYTVTYDGGEGSDPVTDVKTHGEPLTLRGETFKMDGFVQTGWVDKETDAAYRLGDTYTENADVTLTPVFEKIITLTVPYTTTVALGDVGVPGEKTFTLALIGDSAPDKDKSNVTITGSVTTNGKGSYNGTLTITGTERTLWVMLSEGAFVQQVDAGEDGWTVDDTVWGVLMEEIPVAYAMGDDAAASGYTVYAVPASIDGNGYYYIDRENLQAADMAFTNIYTKSVFEPAENDPVSGNPDLPQTGDNSSMILRTALLLVSGSAVIGMIAAGKKRKYN